MAGLSELRLMTDMKILIIEDEQRIARRIQRMVTSFLGEQLESVCICDALPEGISYLENNEIDLLLLDLNLNGESGFDVLELMVSSFTMCWA